MSATHKLGQAACFVFAAYIAVCCAVLAIGSVGSIVYLAGHYLLGAF